MKVPFSVDQFLNVFRDYNLAVWPMQVVLVIMALLAVFVSIRKTIWSDKVISAVLSFFWLWMGIVYHLLYFTSINKAAYIFGTLYVVQGVLLAYYGLLKGRLSFQFTNNMYGRVGLGLIIYALVVYPLLGIMQGRSFPVNPTFGLPCPTTIFTFGMLLFTNKRFPFALALIPFLWSLLGTSAALKFGIREDLGLFISGVMFMGLVLYRNRKAAAMSV